MISLVSFSVAIRTLEIKYMAHICSLRVTLLDSTGLGHFLQVVDLYVLYLVIICIFPPIQVFGLNAVPISSPPQPSSRKLGFILFAGSLFLGQ